MRCFVALSVAFFLPLEAAVGDETCAPGDDTCSFKSGRRCPQPDCTFLDVGDWLEVGDRLIPKAKGEHAERMSASITADGDFAVLYTNYRGSNTGVVWQALDESSSRPEDGCAGSRLELRADRLVTLACGRVVWEQQWQGTASRVGLSRKGEVVVKRVGGGVVWRNGATFENMPEPEGQEEVAVTDEAPSSESAAEPPRCEEHPNCEKCLEHNCGWCINRRKCYPDEPYHCDSGSDSVSKKCQFEDQLCECPSREDIDAEVQQRRVARKEAAEERARLAKEAAEESREAKEQGGTPEERAQRKAKKLLRELEQRARMADEDAGQENPYNVLGVTRGSTQSEIRRAYRKLSLRLHPDKNPQHEDLARRAFADLGLAYERLGSPDKRAAFDEHGGRNFDQEWRSQQWRGDEDFFFGSQYVATITLKLWEKRLVGDSIWLLDLYAAWCPHCRRFVSIFQTAAKYLADEESGVEAGGINCVKQRVICNERIGSKGYPTLVLLNRESGMMQRFPDGRKMLDARYVANWAKKVASEWRYLLKYGKVKEAVADNFDEALNTTDMVAVLFTDGVECMPCKTAKTNLMRLSASLAGMPFRAVVVDCEDPDNKNLCYQEHELPAPPHRPVIKLWPRVAEVSENRRGEGEMLYRAQELESHLALELLERALRLALGPERRPDNVTDGETGNYTKEEEDDDEESGSSGGSQPSWEEGFSGQRLSGGHRPAIQFDGPDHQDRPGAHQAPQAPPTWHGPRFEHVQIN